MRLTIAHLEALDEAAATMTDAVQRGSENEEFNAQAELAEEARDWIRKEIKKRRNRSTIRRALKDAVALLAENNRNTPRCGEKG